MSRIRTLCTESSCSQAHTPQHACGERFAELWRTQTLCTDSVDTKVCMPVSPLEPRSNRRLLSDQQEVFLISP